MSLEENSCGKRTSRKMNGIREKRKKKGTGIVRWKLINTKKIVELCRICHLMMLANENTREIYGMSTMNDDQGTLLNNESVVKDEYTLSYR